MLSLHCKNFTPVGKEKKFVRFSIALVESATGQAVVTTHGFRYDPAALLIAEPSLNFKRRWLPIAELHPALQLLIAKAMSKYYEVAAHTFTLPEGAQTIEITDARLRSLLERE